VSAMNPADVIQFEMRMTITCSAFGEGNMTGKLHLQPPIFRVDFNKLMILASTSVAQCSTNQSFIMLLVRFTFVSALKP